MKHIVYVCTHVHTHVHACVHVNIHTWCVHNVVCHSVDVRGLPPGVNSLLSLWVLGIELSLSVLLCKCFAHLSPLTSPTAPAFIPELERQEGGVACGPVSFHRLMGQVPLPCATEWVSGLHAPPWHCHWFREHAAFASCFVSFWFVKWSD